jgi:hypothetical protein
MKSRLLIRSLCVGAALFVPAGGLTVLGVGTAGATQNTIQFVATSTAKLGTLGTATLNGVLCTVILAVGTQQCTIIGASTTTKTNKTAQIPILITTVHVLTLLLTSATTKTKILFTIITTAGALKFHKIGFKAATIKTVTIKSFGGHTTTRTGCKIAGMPAITYSKTGTTGRKFKTITNSLSGTSVTGCAGGSTTNSAIATQLHGSKLNGIITISSSSNP